MLRLIFFILLFNFITIGCNQIHEGKHQIRLFLGLATPTPAPEAEEPAQDFKKEGEKIVEITPQKKFYNLINGYVSTPDAGIKNILVREFQVNGKIFKEEDLDLLSALSKLSPLIQEGNVDAMEIAFQAYANIEGVNQEIIAPIVASGFDYQAKKTLELYLSLKKDIYCSLISVFRKDIDDEKKKLIMEARKNNVLEVLNDPTIPESLKLLISECEKTLQLDSVKGSLKKPLAVEMPEVFPTPEETDSTDP